MAHAFVCSNQSAKAVAHQLWHNYFCVYGFPRCLHSDQGANFESALISELLSVAGVQKSHTTPYHPMGNMIRVLPPKAKQQWPDALKAFTFAYKCTVHETTGFAPFLLMFGRVPRLSIDIIFGSVIDHHDITDYGRYVQTLRKGLKEGMDIAQRMASKQLQRHTDLYNRKVRGSPVEIGDRVLLAKKKGRGKRKLADRWENVVYTVLDKNDTSHTFKLQNASTGQEKIVHRNLLMPVNFLPLEGALLQEEVDVSSESGLLTADGDGETVDEMSVASAEYRTRAWVSDLPSEVSSELLMTEDIEPEGTVVDHRLVSGCAPTIDSDIKKNSTNDEHQSDLIMSEDPAAYTSALEAATSKGLLPPCSN
ncbi:uncharacterized protein LOC103470669 isoform X2 [Poecilia reticulata]|uniref:uncharacterized protein LOC103470669 isoform X1 n=1 Tax=Poecilia reticulata TaxID=8081 RepID=UPI0004A2CD24|nr:PREDICTED: uncharacterized protein LOC103470669 isoform X1 [Poecilia reticulata]XP_008417508.1 PREDICTED: uncharacterized protein LOC103470669 isoform X2 [Poecilia reticulata]